MMDDQHPAVTRRAAIASFAAVGLASAIPGAAQALTSPASPRVRWEAALRDYQMKRRYCDSLHVDDLRSEAALDAYCIAMDHLVENVPAPNTDALLYKMELAKERWDGFSLPTEWMDAFMSDVRYLRNA